jgi:hypothetical protein
MEVLQKGKAQYSFFWIIFVNILQIYYANGGSTEVKLSPRYLKVEGLSLALSGKNGKKRRVAPFAESSNKFFFSAKINFWNTQNFHFVFSQPVKPDAVNLIHSSALNKLERSSLTSFFSLE